MSRRRLLAVLAASVAAGCAASGPVKIGFLGGMSGRVADLGIGGRNGTLLAVEELNAAGGVGGRRLELLVQDDEQNAEVARRQFGALLDAGVVLVIGPMTSAMGVAVVPIADQRRVPLISPTTTTHELSGKADAFFRVVPDAPAGARQQASYVRARGRQRLVTVMDSKNRAFAESWTRAAAKQFTAAGGALAEAIEFEGAPGLRFTELAQRIVGARPDAVIVAASAADSALLTQQIRKLDAELLVALSSWAGTEELPQLGGRALDGTIVAQYFDRASRAPAYLSFVDRFRRRFGEAPGYPAVNAYDAVALGVAALGAAGPSGDLLAALRGIRQLQGLQRVVPIDEFGDAQAPMFLTELRDGAYAGLGGS